MTVRQLYLFSCLYLVMLIATAVFTRATLRRIAGALAGAAVVGAAALGIVAAGEHAGWWHMAIIWEPWFLALLWANFVLCAYALLITWRIARRFGGRGLAVVALAGAILGPPRDYWYMTHFPEWVATERGLLLSSRSLRPMWSCCSWGKGSCDWSPGRLTRTGLRADCGRLRS